MRLLGIDYGRKRIGLAFSEGFLPSPLSVILVKTQVQVLTDIKRDCQELGIEKLVMGISQGILEKEMKAFGEKLSTQMGIPIVFIEEAFTSKTAIRKMVEGNTTQKKRKTMEDATAAALILERFLEEAL